MSNKAATISAAVPADVKAEAVAVAEAHGMSLAVTTCIDPVGKWLKGCGVGVVELKIA